jgi:Mn-containing catalase
MSEGEEARGPWNEGQGPWSEGNWNYIDDPAQHVGRTRGLVEQPIEGTSLSAEEAQEVVEQLGEMRSREVKEAAEQNPNQWSTY